MNKEKILEGSRRENKNRDLAEMEVTAQAGNIAGRVGAAVCVVLTLIFRIFTKTYFLSPWVVYFSILTTHTLVKYARLKRKTKSTPQRSTVLRASRIESRLWDTMWVRMGTGTN